MQVSQRCSIVITENKQTEPRPLCAVTITGKNVVPIHNNVFVLKDMGGNKDMKYKKRMEEGKGRLG